MGRAWAVAGLVMVAACGAGKEEPPRPLETQPGTRPTWARGGTSLSGTCSEQADGASCGAASTYAPDRNDALAEADYAALDALVAHAARRVPADSTCRILWQGGDSIRRANLARLSKEARFGRVASDDAVAEEVRPAQKAVGDALLATSPRLQFPSFEHYWERFDEGTVVYSRVTVDERTMRGIVSNYTTRVPIGDEWAATFFPGAAWKHSGRRGGAVLVDQNGEVLRFVDEWQDEAIRSAEDLFRLAMHDRIRESGGIVVMRQLDQEGECADHRIPVPRSPSNRGSVPDGERRYPLIGDPPGPPPLPPGIPRRQK